MDQSEPTAPNLDRRSRRRWSQFSLRGFLVVLTIACLWLGWKVEKARKRGRAIDAILRDGESVNYIYEYANGPRMRSFPDVDHFWDDLNARPVMIVLHGPLNASLCSSLSDISGICTLSLLANQEHSEMHSLAARSEECIVFVAGQDAGIDVLRRKWPKAKVYERSVE